MASRCSVNWQAQIDTHSNMDRHKKVIGRDIPFIAV
ncbi:hypothetical protein AAKU61_000172 [Undibacterium sp. GrIS 1.2]